MKHVSNQSFKFDRIAEAVLSGGRLSKEDGLKLLQLQDFTQVIKLADSVRKRVSGNKVLYAVTLCLYPTNICEYSCPLCSFSHRSNKPFQYSQEELLKKVEDYLPYNINEIHIVSGLHRSMTLPYYTTLFTQIKSLAPQLHIKALSAIEIAHLAKHHCRTIEEVLLTLKSSGLGSLPGGGAEILNDAIRKQICPQKLVSEEFLTVHKTAHRLQIPSNITMLYGHIEEDIHIIEHLDSVRRLQDETGGIIAFVPLKFRPENSGMANWPLNPKEAKRIFAISRLMLDNVCHIKALWNYEGIDSAIESLKWGVDDLASTNIEEQIMGRLPLTEEQLRMLIEKAGRVPLRVTSGAL